MEVEQIYNNKIEAIIDSLECLELCKYWISGWKIQNENWIQISNALLYE